MVSAHSSCPCHRMRIAAQRDDVDAADGRRAGLRCDEGLERFPGAHPDLDSGPRSLGPPKDCSCTKIANTMRAGSPWSSQGAASQRNCSYGMTTGLRVPLIAPATPVGRSLRRRLRPRCARISRQASGRPCGRRLRPVPQERNEAPRALGQALAARVDEVHLVRLGFELRQHGGKSPVREVVRHHVVRMHRDAVAAQRRVLQHVAEVRGDRAAYPESTWACRGR